MTSTHNAYDLLSSIKRGRITDKAEVRLLESAVAYVDRPTSEHDDDNNTIHDIEVDRLERFPDEPYVVGIVLYDEDAR